MLWGRHKGMHWALALVGTLLLLGAQDAQAQDFPMQIKVIHASKAGKGVDPKIRALVKDFGNLGFSNYKLLDEATFRLSKGRSYQMEMPNGAWMKVALMQSMKNGAIRIQMESKKVMKFKTTAKVEPGATIAVGGPSYKGGRLIFAATLKKK